MIVGFPNETDETLKKTFQFVKEVKPSFVSLSALALYPHEDPKVTEQYEAGVCREPIWVNYDEGFGAVHPNMDAKRAESVWDLAKSELGSLLDVAGTPE